MPKKNVKNKPVNVSLSEVFYQVVKNGNKFKLTALKVMPIQPTNEMTQILTDAQFYDPEAIVAKIQVIAEKEFETKPTVPPEKRVALFSLDSDTAIVFRSIKAMIAFQRERELLSELLSP